MKRVTYILPTRNRATFLATTLGNIREFMTDEDELIVMDAASTDDTAAVVRANGDLVTTFVSEPDKGEAHALNKAILMTTGRYIKLLADDDYFYPAAMKQAILALETHPDCDALVTGGEDYRYVGEGKAPELLGYQQLPKGMALTGDYTGVFYYIPCGAGFFITRSCFARYGLFDTFIRPLDVEYMARLVRLGATFRYFDVNLYRHMEYPHSGGTALMDEHNRGLTRLLWENRRWEWLPGAEDPVLRDIVGKSLMPGNESAGLQLADILLNSVGLLNGQVPMLRCVSWLSKWLHGLRQARWRLSPSHEGPAGVRNRISTTPPVWDGTVR